MWLVVGGLWWVCGGWRVVVGVWWLVGGGLWLAGCGWRSVCGVRWLVGCCDGTHEHIWFCSDVLSLPKPLFITIIASIDHHFALSFSFSLSSIVSLLMIFHGRPFWLKAKATLRCFFMRGGWAALREWSVCVRPAMQLSLMSWGVRAEGQFLHSHTDAAVPVRVHFKTT